MGKWLLYAFLGIGIFHPTYSSSSYLTGMADAAWEVFPHKGRTVRYRVERNFFLGNSRDPRALYRVVQRAMNEANPKHEGLSILQMNHLSRDVVQTAQCYGVDPIIFAGLIWRESNFKPASVSETGAVGFTQMTGMGVQEVLERLAKDSPRRMDFLRSKAMRCTPGMLRRIDNEVSADEVSLWKNRISLSHSYALAMGAILLKINLASVTFRPGVGTQLGMYRDALERYNGDVKVKAQFATDVLLLAKRMIKLPEIALNDSKYLSLIRDL